MTKLSKLTAILLILTLMVGLSGCGKKSKIEYNAEKPFAIIEAGLEVEGHKDVRYGMTAKEVTSLLGDQGLIEETESGTSYSYDLADVYFTHQINADAVHYIFSEDDELVTVTVDGAYADGVTPDYLALKKDWAEKISSAGVPFVVGEDIPDEIFTQGVLNNVTPYFALWEADQYGITYFFMTSDNQPKVYVSESMGVETTADKMD